MTTRPPMPSAPVSLSAQTVDRLLTQHDKLLEMLLLMWKRLSATETPMVSDQDALLQAIRGVRPTTHSTITPIG
mgnify:FL=1